MNELEQMVVQNLQKIVKAYDACREDKCATCKHITCDARKEPCSECRWAYTDYWEKRE